MWLGREHNLLQGASLGLRMLLGGGRACFRKLLLGRGPKEELQSGLAGNHVLVSQAKPTKIPTLPPTAEDLSENFVAIFCKSVEELEKSQFLKVAREDYKILARERCAVNASFAAKSMNWNAVDEWPVIGVPEELRRCGMQMPEAEHMQFATSGPGTIRQPIDAALGAEGSDASDELAEELDEPSGCANSAAQPAPQDASYDEETVLGIDQAAGPNVVQCLAAFKLQTDLLREHVQQSTAQPEASSDMTAITAQAARQADCARIVYDLQAAGKKLLKYNFQTEVSRLDKQEKGLLVPSGSALSTFDAATWTECFTEFWYGDALPNQKHRPRPITFEEIFAALPDREELEYTLASDERPYAARAKSRFDNPEIIIVFGDTLRRLELFQSTRAIMKRHGFQANAQILCKATSEDCMKEIEARVGQPGVRQNAGAEDLQQNVPRPLQVALSQMLISTKHTPLTDGYRRNLRHEGHNLNVMFGSLTVFATFNFADNYAPLMFQLVRHNGSAEQPADGEVVGTIDVSAEQPDDAPRMPTLKEMHKLVGQSPRAQAKFFLLMDDLGDRFFMGIDGSFVGRHRVHSAVPQNLCEDSYASTCEPSLGGLGVGELEPFESQQRGFTHGHRKKYSIPTNQHQDIIDMFTHQGGLQVREFLQGLKAALLACASSLQYEDSTLPAHQMGQTVLPEKFTAKQQQQSRLDGGFEEDGVTKRALLETTADEHKGHEVLEHRRAAAERRPPSNCYSHVELTGCHQSLMPTYRLPQRIGSILPLDELGMASSSSTTSAEQPVVIWTTDEEANHVSNVCLVTGGSAEELSAEDLVNDAGRWGCSFCRDFRALSQLNHNHDCTSTCIKYVKQKVKDIAQEALRLGRVVACRFFFFHIVVVNVVASLLSKVGRRSGAEQPADESDLTTAATRRIRRRGRKLVPQAYIASTNEHNEFCRAVVQRATPFRSATTDAGQVWGRCNIDFQFMIRSLDPDILLHDSAAAQTVPQVKPELALALYAVRTQLPDSPLLRRCFHSIVAMFQAAHNCDYYITKYQGKSMEQLQNLFAQIATGLRRLQLEEQSAAEPSDRQTLARKTLLRIAMAANRSTWCSCCELAIYIKTGGLCRKTHAPVQVFLSRPSFQLHQCGRLLHRSHVQVIEAPDDTGNIPPKSVGG